MWSGGRKGKTKLSLQGNVRKRRCGKGGPCKHTPYTTVKNKDIASLLLGQPLPRPEAWHGGSFPSHSHSQLNTQETDNPLRTSPGVQGSARLISEALKHARTHVYMHTHKHTHMHTHTYKHFEPVTATVIQRQLRGGRYAGPQNKGNETKRIK